MGYPFTKGMFAELCAWQCTQEEICASYGKTPDEMNAWCLDECGTNFETAHERYTACGRVRIREMMFALAKENAEIAIWLSKVYLGLNA